MQHLKKGITMLLCTLVLLCFSFGAMGAEGIGYHTVKQGDSVYKIAKGWGVSTEAVVNANGLKNGGTDIYPNMVLVMDANAKNTVGGNYTVKAGDSLFHIGQNYGISVAKLKSDNGLTADRIYAGQKLIVNGKCKTQDNNKAATTATIQDNNKTVATATISEDEIYMMAKMIYGEARGESYEGQVAVGAVIMNRLKSSSFPNTMSGVLFQKNQFTAVDDGQYFMTPDGTAVQAARDAASGVDPTGGSLFYWNPVKAPNNAFLNAKPVVVTIGSHVYAK